MPAKGLLSERLREHSFEVKPSRLPQAHCWSSHSPNRLPFRHSKPPDPIQSNSITMKTLEPPRTFSRSSFLRTLAHGLPLLQVASSRAQTPGTNAAAPAV